MEINIKLSENISNIQKKIELTTETAQIKLARQALEDCNRFCKVETGTLRNSSYTSSDFNTGELVWEAPYARHAYYLGEANINKNPNAVKMWAHAAAVRYKKDWLDTARSAFGNYYKDGENYE